MNDLPYNPGDVLLGKFRMDRVLGAGAMGLVVSATHLGLNQRVAIKFMLANKSGTREQNERFLREAQAAVQLQSQHVARVTDVGTTEHGAPYLVMELLNGKDLEAVLEQRGPLPYSEAVDYVLQASEAIAEAHHLGIVHRDLKPANLFLATVTGRPCVKVLDFGVAKILNAAKLTTDGASVGSPYYMSPEQMRDGSAVDVRSDIWALGVILYQLVTGHPPFDSDTMAGLCAQIFMQPPTPMRNYRADVPSGFESVILRCLDKDREARIQTVAEFANAIAPFGSPATAAYPARIAAAAGAPIPFASSASGLDAAPVLAGSSSAAPAHGSGATTVTPIVSLGSSSISVPQPRRGAGMAIVLGVTVLSLAGAGVIYLRVRHVVSVSTGSASAVGNADAAPTALASSVSMSPTIALVPSTATSGSAAAPAVTLAATVAVPLSATSAASSGKRAASLPPHVPQRPEPFRDHPPAGPAPRQPTSAYDP